MSNIPKVTITDPIVDFQEQQFYAVTRGAQTITYIPFTTTSFSNSQVTFSVNPPSPNTIIDRKVLWGIPFQLTFTPAGPLAPGVNTLNIGETDSLRAFPLAQITNTMQISLNNNSISANINRILPAALHYSTEFNDEALDYSHFPSFQDQSQNYDDLVGSVRNPMGAYDNSGIPHMIKRGEFPLQVVSNNGVGAVVRGFIFEWIWISPFIFGKNNEKGLIGLKTMTVTINLAPLIRLWSHSNLSVTFGNVVGTIEGLALQPTMLMRYLTPNATIPISPVNTYSYFTFNTYVTPSLPILAGATGTITSLNQQFNSIPTRIYIFLNRQKADKESLAGISTTDTFATINSINILFNAVSGILASATQQKLYDISKENGCKMSWVQWSGIAGSFANAALGTTNRIGTIGSVLAIDPGKDMGLVDLAPGVTGTFQFQITITATNTSNADIIYDLNVITITEGILTIDPSNTTTETGVVTQQDVILAPEATKIEEVQAIEEGGNFWGNVKRFLSKAIPVATKTAQLIPGISPFASAASPALEELARQLGSGKHKRGGQMMSSDDLKRRRMMNI